MENEYHVEYDLVHFSADVIRQCNGKTPYNPSRKAIARVKHPLPIPTRCDNCGGHVEPCENKHVYGENMGEWPFMYRCEECYASVGMHPFTNIPLGTLADEPTRKARTSAKAAFHELKAARKWDRTESYAWLANQLGIERRVCHFGMFWLERCALAEAICKAELSGHYSKDNGIQTGLGL